MAALTVKAGTTALTEAFGVSFQEVHNDLGSGSLSMLSDDPNLSAVTYGTVITPLLDTTPIGHWIVEQKERRRIIDPESDTGYTFTGRTTIAELERSIVYPPRPPELVSTPIFSGYAAPKPYTDERHLGAMDTSYDTSGWGSATQIVQARSVFAPVAWNDPDAYWIGGSGGAHGYYHFYKSFTSAGFAVVIQFAMADDGELWMDGTLVARVSAATDENPQTRTRRVIVETNGTNHYIYARVQALAVPDPLFLCTVWGKGTNTNYARTGSSWKALPDVEAGYTPHQIMNILITEAQSRGELTGWTLTSTATNDSDGTPWPTVSGDFALRVGDTVLDVLRQLSETYIDFAVEPGDGPRELSMYVADGVARPGGTGVGRGSTKSVTLAEGTNILELSHSVVA